jgi:hypothetical protein
MSAEAAELYLLAVINRHRACPDDGRPERLRRQIKGVLRHWALGGYVESVTLSGSHSKSTALRDSDVDFFLSLSPDTPGPLAAIHTSLADHFRDYLPRPRNVSLRIQMDGSSVDLVPGRRREGSTHHTLWQQRYDTWLQTDIGEQIRHVESAGLTTEMLALKLWRRRRVLRFPSFLLELSVIRALSRSQGSGADGRISESLLKVFQFLKDNFPSTRLLDPANSNNAVSDALTPEDKLRIATAADMSLRAESWTEII